MCFTDLLFLLLLLKLLFDWVWDWDVQRSPDDRQILQTTGTLKNKTYSQ